MAARIATIVPVEAPSRGRRVQLGINALKSTIDDSLADGSRLLAEMIGAGREAGVLPQVSQRALERMHACVKAGLEMRALAIDTHHDLRKIMGQLDMEAVGFGDTGPTTSMMPSEAN